MMRTQNGASGTETPEQLFLNDPESSLKGVDCPICGNRGMITRVENGLLWSAECRCMRQRRTLRNIRNSGLENLVARYTFGAYKSLDPEADRVKKLAMSYAADGDGWFYICGRPGSGKTHICIAICSSMLKNGHEVKYMLWRETAPRLKSLVNDMEAYKEIMEPLKKADVLYIDDFLKGNITDADINLAFELINTRYNDNSKRTIISSELSIGSVLNADEAIGSRIVERAQGYCLASPKENRRLKQT